MKTCKPIICVFLLIAIFQVAAVPLCRAGIFELKRNTEHDTVIINYYTRNAIKYARNPANPELMKVYIDSAELICHKKNIEIPPRLHLARAQYFFLVNDYKNSFQEANIAMKLAKSRNDQFNLASIFYFIGFYHLKTGLFDESISHFESCIQIAKKEKIRGIITKAYRGIAEVYISMGKVSEYREYLNKVIETAKKEKNTWYLQEGYYTLGTSYANEDFGRDSQKADSLLNLCVESSRLLSDTFYISRALANLGWNSYLDKKYNEAIQRYNESLRYSIPAGRHENAANALGNLGTIYRDIGKTELALKYYARSIDESMKEDDAYNLYWVYKDMSDMYLSKGDTSKAYKYYVLYNKYNDSYLKNSNVQGMTDAKIRYEAEARNKELELLSLRIKNQRLIIYGSAGLFILSVALFILVLSRAKINSKRRMSEMRRKISEITQANLRQQMNPHFIFNTLNSIQYYMYQHDKLATNNYLTKFSSLMRKVLENSQHTSVPLRDELDALNLYLELEKIRFKDKFDYEIVVEEDIDPILYKIPTMLIQPYVENSICHGLVPSEEKGLVKVDLKLKKSYIQCVIEDNGIGRDAAQARSAHKKNHRSIGTQIVNSRLDLVNALYGTELKTIYTDLKDQDGNPLGTRVEIHIPILT
jgi:tetratricopeptide (TPR) repeat protein